METRIMSIDQTLDELETEVMETLDNPYSTYQVTLPYTCIFTIPDDDNITEVTISTKSQMIRYGRNEQDIEFELELDRKHSESTYAKHILKWTANQLFNIDPKNVEVKYGTSPDIKLMTNEEIDDYRNDCLRDE